MRGPGNQGKREGGFIFEGRGEYILPAWKSWRGNSSNRGKVLLGCLRVLTPLGGEGDRTLHLHNGVNSSQVRVPTNWEDGRHSIERNMTWLRHPSLQEGGGMSL